MQIIWSICDKNFNLVRPALQFSLQKCHIWNRNYEIFDISSKFWYFCSTYKRNGYFFMSMKWMFTFKNFRNVYWHGKTHSPLSKNPKILIVLLIFTVKQHNYGCLYFQLLLSSSFHIPQGSIGQGDLSHFLIPKVQVPTYNWRGQPEQKFWFT